MPRINTYDLDTTPSLSDKWIGTDSETTTTKNFTVSSIINLINSSSSIDHFDGASYEFKAIDSENPNPTGVICVTETNVLATAFSAINNIFVSKVHATGDDVAAYLQAMDNDTIKINQAGNLNAFGIFKVTNIQTYSSDSNFLQFTLTYQSGNGNLTPNERYFISNYQAIENIDFSTKSVTELSDVTGAGSGSIITTAERGIVGNALVHNDVVDNLTTSTTDVPLSANQGKLLNDAITAINTLLSSDETDLDTLQEIVDFIQVNKTTLDSLSISSISGLSTALAGKVDAVTGKGLSSNDFTDLLLTKLNGIADGAEVNVQADFDQTNTAADSFILNKPTDLTDLSTHNVTELNDVNSAGSGYIITNAERTKLGAIDVDPTNLTITDGTDTITVSPSSRTIEVAGTSNEVEVSPTGAQNLTANRTFTVGLPDDVTIGNNLTVTDDLLSKTIISKYISTTKTYTVTVATKASTHRYYNSGSPNGYVIDGVPAPYITLTPGNTYRFDMSHTTNSTHPLYFFYNSDKSTPTGLSSNKYITGVTDNYSTNAPGQNGSYIEIVADENTPTVLHYMCDNHQLMGNAVNFNTRNLNDFSINALVDIDLTGVANDKILKYNSTTGKFEVADESGGTVTETFKTIAVTGTAGQSDVVAETATDTLTLNAGSGMSITTNATSDIITLASTATGGTDLNTLNADTIDVTADSFGFIDSSDSNNSKKSTIASLVSAIAGNNLTATNGQLNAQAGGGGGTVTVEKDVHTGNGTTAGFSTTTSIDNINNVQVYIDGVYQSKNNYTASGNTITFTNGVPGNGTSVELIHMVSTSGVIARDTFTGGNNNAAFTLSMSISNVNATQVYIDGVYQSKSNYSTNGNVLTFNTAPATGTSIEVVHIKAVNATSINQNNFTGNGNQTFQLSQSIDDEAKTFVFIQGVYQEKSTYSISGNQITFNTAPQTGFTVEVMAFDSITIGNQNTVTSLNGQTGAVTLSTGIDWQSAHQNSNFTAVAGKGYFINTTSSAITMTMPSNPSVGDTVSVIDAYFKFQSNALTIASSDKINGTNSNFLLSTVGKAVEMVYSGSVKGWLVGSDADDHAAEDIMKYLVVAGGAAGGNYLGGGGGAGGVRSGNFIPTSGVQYTATVGQGGAGVSTTSAAASNNGGNSSLAGSGITTVSATGGGGAGGYSGGAGAAGGSGGGGGVQESGGGGAAGAGNAGGYAPVEGFNGGAGSYRSAGNVYGPSGAGGGASEAGDDGLPNQGIPVSGHKGGDGVTSNITGLDVIYGGGGGAATYTGSVANGVSLGGAGGGGNGAGNNTGVTGGSGTDGLGGGGGGGTADGNTGNGKGGDGGDGVVILSVPTLYFTNTTTGSPTITTSGANTIIKFTGSGTYTH